MVHNCSDSNSTSSCPFYAKYNWELAWVCTGILVMFLLIRIFFWIYLWCKNRQVRTTVEPTWHRALLLISFIAVAIAVALTEIYRKRLWWTFVLPRDQQKDGAQVLIAVIATLL